MLIILEGPDGAGKTTLAKELERVLRNDMNTDVTTLHAGPPKFHSLDEYETSLIICLQHYPVIVCDRWHLGEAVYPSVLRRETDWDRAIERHVYMFMKSRGAYVVLLNPSVDTLTERMILSTDQLITPDQVPALVEGYNNLDIRHFNMMVTSNGVATWRIIEDARHLASLVKPLRRFETYVGSPRPRILVFGDRRGVNGDKTNTGMPAFMPYPGTSGHFLLKYLDVIEYDIGIANACDVDDPVTLWQTLDFPLICALGKKAHVRLKQLDMPHAVVPHPQFIRRFHHAHGARYTDMLMKATLAGEDMLSWCP